MKTPKDVFDFLTTAQVMLYSFALPVLSGFFLRSYMGILDNLFVKKLDNKPPDSQQRRENCRKNFASAGRSLNGSSLAPNKRMWE